MAEEKVPEHTVIWVDADGNPTDKDQAVGGEIIETLPDGTIQSTIFRLGASQ
jgi:hypothetical protein